MMALNLIVNMNLNTIDYSYLFSEAQKRFSEPPVVERNLDRSTEYNEYLTLCTVVVGKFY
jgi:hypothetical protein